MKHITFAMLVACACSCDAFAAAPPLPKAIATSRSSIIVCRKFEPKEGWKVREGTKRDDKSWGLFEWASQTFGGSSDAVDTGPRSTAFNNRRGATQRSDLPIDESGNWKGDRRVFSNQKKKTVNDGDVKFNPFDASTW